jgi:hypothetical protein
MMPIIAALPHLDGGEVADGVHGRQQLGQVLDGGQSVACSGSKIASSLVAVA